MQAAPDAAEGGESGEAHLVKPDREYQHPAPLWRAYGACVMRARKKAAARRCACCSGPLCRTYIELTHIHTMLNI